MVIMKFFTGSSYSMKKIVWLTGFSSDLLQKNLKLNKEIRTFAPWIPNSINAYYCDYNYEIHVITAHYYIGRSYYFKDENIHYHVVNQGIPFFGFGWAKLFPFDKISKFKNIRFSVKKIIRKINPDIIHVWGAEIPIASVTLDLTNEERKKTIVSLQGFKVTSGKDKAPKYRIELQNSIMRSNNNFFITCNWMKGILEQHKKTYNSFDLIYPIKLPEVNENIVKKYDILFYARITYSKGIEDLLRALYILKAKGKNYTCLIIGPADKDYLSKIKQMIDDFDLTDRITFTGFLKTQEEVFNKAQESKIYVLPTHDEVLASSVREAMAMKLPVITYDVGCMNILNNYNKNSNTIFLVERFNIDELAICIDRLLSDNSLYNEVKNSAFEFIYDFNSLNKFKNQTLIAYNSLMQ